MMVQDIKKHFNNSVKEIQENSAKQLQVLKEKKENTTKQVDVLKEKKESTYQHWTIHSNNCTEATIQSVRYRRASGDILVFNNVVCSSCIQNDSRLWRWLRLGSACCTNVRT